VELRERLIEDLRVDVEPEHAGGEAGPVTGETLQAPPDLLLVRVGDGLSVEAQRSMTRSRDESAAARSWGFPAASMGTWS
jgi:hypothetical protein